MIQLCLVLGQWSVYKCQQWILEERIKYHYPELVANAKACEIVSFLFMYNLFAVCPCISHTQM